MLGLGLFSKQLHPATVFISPKLVVNSFQITQMALDGEKNYETVCGMFSADAVFQRLHTRHWPPGLAPCPACGLPGRPGPGPGPPRAMLWGTRGSTALLGQQSLHPAGRCPLGLCRVEQTPQTFFYSWFKADSCVLLLFVCGWLAVDRRRALRIPVVAALSVHPKLLSTRTLVLSSYSISPWSQVNFRAGRRMTPT